MAGAGYKLFNTGDVLTAAQVNTYLMEQTVMVFANAAARTTALSGVVSEGMISYLKDTNAVEVYDGSNWVSSDDPNAIQNTIVDAKGDLISASAADTPARLAVGNNGETLVADSSTSTGLRWNTSPTIGNPVINGGMDIWQRGTSFTIPSATATYTADRFQAYRGATGMTVTRETTGDTTNLPFIQYCARIRRDTGNTSTSPLQFGYSFESVNSIPYAGRTVTISFYARAGALFSPGTATFYLQTGTGTDQNYFGGFTGATNIVNAATVNTTTTWQRFSFTATVGASTTQLGFAIVSFPTGTAGATDWFEVTGIQIDVGSIALPFRRSGNTLAGELAACQRYYYRNTPGVTYGSYAATGVGFNATTAVLTCIVPVPMRTNPSTTVEFSQINLIDGTNAYAVTAASIASVQTGNFGVFVTFNAAAGLVQYRPYSLGSNNNANAYLGFSAEL